MERGSMGSVLNRYCPAMPAAISLPVAVDAVSVSIAGAALFVSAVSAAFQIYSWRRSHRTGVEPIVRRMTLHPEDEEVVLVQMINHSSHEVCVTHLSFKPQREGDPFLFIPRPFPVHEPVPILIGPRRSKQVWITLKTLAEAQDLSQPIQARVSTDDNHDFDSKPILLEGERRSA